VSEHEISVYTDNSDSTIVFCEGEECDWRGTIESPVVTLQEINALAMEHLAPSMTARAVIVPLNHIIDGEQMRERLWQIADVPAQGYVHGLDPAEEDPRRGVLE
jgi:hypothetical protein